jgi:hypothetical protein
VSGVPASRAAALPPAPERRAWSGDVAELHERIAPLVEAGMFVARADGRYELAPDAGTRTPFLFRAKTHDYQCFVWFHVLFERFGVIPARCRDCHKTAVYPETLAQLLQLYAFQQGYEHLAKCGAELRDYVPARYSGYFYHASREAALSEHHAVRTAVEAAVDGPLRVVLKRACTEFGLGMEEAAEAWQSGPPDATADGAAVSTAAAEAELEAAVTALFVADRHRLDGDGSPAATERRLAWRLWVTWAARHGDPTLESCLAEPGPFIDHVLVELPGALADTPFMTVLPMG